MWRGIDHASSSQFDTYVLQDDAWGSTLGALETTGVNAMEVSEVLKKAWTAVENASLPESIQLVAFREAVRILAPQTYSIAPQLSQTPPSRNVGGIGRGSRASTSADEEGGHEGLGVSEAEIYDRVAEHTGVDRSKIEQVVHVDGDALKVSIPGIKLGKNNAEKTRTIAQILTIVRGFGLDETDSPLDLVRAEANRLKCYDSPNFSSQLSKLSGFVITGSGTNRRIRAKAAGIAAFPGLVDSLLGVD
jgi:hypothetical protein